LSKSDLPGRVGAAHVGALTGITPAVEVSALTGAGIAELVAALGRAQIAGGEDANGGEAVIFRVRHRDAAARAVAAIARAEAALGESAPLELLASDLTAAATALAEITGEITSEDVLDRVFAEFCIGK
jgi:tRNA modification GTPase